MRHLLTAAIIAVTPFAASAQDIEKNIEARQGFYTMLSLNMGTLAGMAKGEIEYNEADASKAAANIEALTQYSLPDLFVEGSAQGQTDIETEALPAIWEDFSGFESKFAGLQDAAAGAADAVKGGQGNVGPVVQKLGGACKDCHDNYRAD